MIDVILYDSFQKWRYPEILSLDHFSIETRINGHFRNPNRRYLPYMRPFFEGSISWDIPPNDGLKKYMAKIEASEITSCPARACADLLKVF